MALATLVAVSSLGAADARGEVDDILVPAWDAVSIDGEPIVIPDDAIAREQDRHPTMSFARHGNDTWATGGGACNGWGAVDRPGEGGTRAMHAGCDAWPRYP